MMRIYQRVSNKPLANDAKGPLPVDVRRSTTLLLKLPILFTNTVTPQREDYQLVWSAKK